MKSLLKNISNYRTLTHKCNKSFSQSYAQIVVNKYIVTRTQNNKFSVYLDPDTTVGQFKAKIQQIFPNLNIGISTNVHQQLGVQVDPIKQKQISQKLKDLLLIDALLLNRIAVYQKNDKNQLQIIYGLEISQFNTTNRINIPEHIEQGVVQLNQEWSSNKLTIANALSFQNIKKYQQLNHPQAPQRLQQNGLTSQQQKAFQQSVGTLIKIRKFQNQVLPFLPSTRRLMKRIIAMMSVNWVFLYYLTYGKYGWDVGQPVSYLTGLGVDLAAITGIFESNQALSSQKQSGKKALQSRLNLKAHEQMSKWRVAYLSRKTQF